MKKSFLIIFQSLFILTLLHSCKKEEAKKDDFENTNLKLKATSNLAYDVLYGKASAHTLVTKRKGIKDGGEGVESPGGGGEGPGGPGGPGDPGPDDCKASLTVNSVNVTDVWAFAVVMLDQNQDPFGPEILVGNCPACDPQIEVGDSFSWSVPDNGPYNVCSSSEVYGQHFDILFISLGLDYSANVTENPSTVCCNLIPEFNGNDTYGPWEQDLHQFNTLLHCNCVATP
ncbi:MAG TPA: hypothetical protein ENJ95_19860 [Bacteroidetes bacterium]|nr:hypothetical protein [Bacteroidota bacterium]